MHYYIVSPQEITERTYDSGVSKGSREGSCPPVSPNYFWLSITKISMSMINFPEWAKSTLSQQCIKRFAIRHYFFFGSHALLRPPQKKNRGRTSSPRNLVMPLIDCMLIDHDALWLFERLRSLLTYLRSTRWQDIDHVTSTVHITWPKPVPGVISTSRDLTSGCTEHGRTAGSRPIIGISGGDKWPTAGRACSVV